MRGIGPGTIVAVLAIGLSALPAWAAEKPGAEPPEPFRYDSGGRRDPFVSLVREGRLVGTAQGVRVDSTTPTLYGILWDPQGDSIALLNEAEVKVGETVAGFRVKAIQRDAVVLDGGGEPVVLRITYEPAPGKPSPPGTPMGGEGP